MRGCMGVGVSNPGTPGKLYVRVINGETKRQIRRRLQDCLYCRLFVFEQATQKWWANFREIWGTSRLWITEECTKF